LGELRKGLLHSLLRPAFRESLAEHKASNKRMADWDARALSISQW